MNLARVCAALSNETRVRLLQLILREGPKSSAAAHSLFVSQYESLRRETIYKSLEQLVDAELLEKYYDRPEATLKYEARGPTLQLDLARGDVEFLE